ncbi:MAG: hypothetical protein ACRDFS_11625 [Chloroflexota bacterium]
MDQPSSPEGTPGPGASVLGLALLGSILLFIGWALAIIPAFHHIHSIALVIAIAVVGSGVALIPAGLDVFVQPAPGPGEKRGVSVLLVSYLPAIILFVVTVTVLPLSGWIRALALLAEGVGLVVYAFAWRLNVSTE